MFLEVVSHTRNVSGDFETVSETNASDLADSGVWLLRSLGGDLNAYAALERRREETRAVGDGVEGTREGDGLGLPLETLPIGLRKLINCRHL